MSQALKIEIRDAHVRRKSHADAVWRCAQMPSCCYTVADATWRYAQMHPIAHHNEQSLYVALPSVYPARSVPHPRASLVAVMIQTRFTSHNLIVLQLEFTSLDVLTDATWLTIMSKGGRLLQLPFCHIRAWYSSIHSDHLVLESRCVAIVSHATSLTIMSDSLLSLYRTALQASCRLLMPPS